MSRLEDALLELEVAVRRVRDALSPESSERGEERWARQMLSVLSDLDKRGGRVSQSDFLRIGERYGYRRRGMAGFYQRLVEKDGNDTVMKEAGWSKLASLRRRYEPLPPRDLVSAFPTTADPFVLHIQEVRTGSGSTYDAETAKRDLYRS